MSMRRFAAILLLGAALAAPTVPVFAAAPPVERILSADTDLVILFEDVPHVLAAWPESPLGRLWSDPAMARFLAPLRDEMKVDTWDESAREKLGVSLDEALAVFTGEAAILVPDFRSLRDEEVEEEPPVFDEDVDAGEEAAEEDEDWHGPVALLARVGGDPELVARLVGLATEPDEDEPADVEYRESEEDFQGIRLHLTEEIRSGESATQWGWTIADEMLVLAEPAEYLRDLVRAIRDGGSAEPLGDDPAFTKSRRMLEGRDMFVLLRVERLAAMLEESLLEDTEEEPNELGFTPQALLDALQLDTFEGIAVTLGLAGREILAESAVVWRAPVGIARLFALPQGPCGRPAFLSVDYPMASVSRFRYAEFWQALRDVVGGLNPELLTMVDAQLQQITAATGVNLERDVLGSLGDEIVSVASLGDAVENIPGVPSPLAAPRMDQAIGFAVADRNALEGALTSLLALAGGKEALFETQEFLGTQIQISRTPMGRAPDEDPEAPEQRFCYAMTDDYLLFSSGSPALLRDVLARMKNPTNPVWEAPGVAEAIAEFPADAVGLAYYDVPRLLRYLAELGAARDPEKEDDAMVEPESIPDVRDIRAHVGHAVVGSWITPDGAVNRARLLPAAP